MEGKTFWVRTDTSYETGTGPYAVDTLALAGGSRAPGIGSVARVA